MEKVKQAGTWIRQKPLRIIMVVLIVIGSLFAVSKLTTKQQSGIQTQTAQVEKGTIVSSVSATGNIIASNTMPVSTTLTGVIKEVFVKDGQTVKKGQKLVEIEPDAASSLSYSQAYAAYLSAKNSLDSANTSLYTLQSQSFAANQKFINDAVARNLSTDDPTYIQEYADWKAAEQKYISQSTVITQAKINLSSQAVSLSQASPIITAPSNGIITNISAVKGMALETTSGGKKVATIETTGLPLASFNISELDVTKVKQGMKATITIDSIADKSFTGKVVSVDKTGTTSNNVTNYPIIIEFDTQVPELLTNMSTQAAIIIDTKQNVVVIPSAAIQKQNGENTVKIMKDGREQTVVVETGITSDTQTEIISGISEGDIIVTGTTTTRSTTGSQSQSVFGGGGANAVFRGAGGFSTTTRITR